MSRMEVKYFPDGVAVNGSFLKKHPLYGLSEKETEMLVTTKMEWRTV